MFSHKHYPTAVFDRNNYYISNYPAVNFTFKSNAGVNMLIDSVIIVPAAKKLSKVYPVY